MAWTTIERTSKNVCNIYLAVSAYKQMLQQIQPSIYGRICINCSGRKSDKPDKKQERSLAMAEWIVDPFREFYDQILLKEAELQNF